MSDPSPAPESSTVRSRKRKSGVVVPHAPTWPQRLIAWLVFVLLRGVGLTWRLDRSDAAAILRNPPSGPVIFCIWHNRLLLSMDVYRIFRKVSQRGGLAALISASRDGGLLTAILERFGVQPVRGSSSRRGPQALLELTTWAERGYDLAITPDGPRGPCGVVQDGVMALAQLTGRPIIPFAYRTNWKIRLRSWDRFIIPLPFARCELKVGPAVIVPRDLPDDARERLRQELERTLAELAGEKPSASR